VLCIVESARPQLKDKQRARVFQGVGVRTDGRAPWRILPRMTSVKLDPLFTDAANWVAYYGPSSGLPLPQGSVTCSDTFSCLS